MAVFIDPLIIARKLLEALSSGKPTQDKEGMNIEVHGVCHCAWW